MNPVRALVKNLFRFVCFRNIVLCSIYRDNLIVAGRGFRSRVGGIFRGFFSRVAGFFAGRRIFRGSPNFYSGV